jgi:hypothetical protein
MYSFLISFLFNTHSNILMLYGLNFSARIKLKLVFGSHVSLDGASLFWILRTERLYP